MLAKYLLKIGICIVLICIAYIDGKTKRIPDKLIIVMTILGMIAACVFPEISIVQRALGIFVISVPLLLLAYIVPGSIGGGDVKLMAAGGLGLGAFCIWRAFVIGILAAGIYAIWLLAVKKAGRKTEIALGPFLCLGMAIAWSCYV